MTCSHLSDNLLLAMIMAITQQRITSIVQAFAVQNLLDCTFPVLAARPATL